MPSGGGEGLAEAGVGVVPLEEEADVALARYGVATGLDPPGIEVPLVRAALCPPDPLGLLGVPSPPLTGFVTPRGLLRGERVAGTALFFIPRGLGGGLAAEAEASLTPLGLGGGLEAEATRLLMPLGLPGGGFDDAEAVEAEAPLGLLGGRAAPLTAPRGLGGGLLVAGVDTVGHFFIPRGLGGAFMDRAPPWAQFG